MVWLIEMTVGTVGALLATNMSWVASLIYGILITLWLSLGTLAIMMLTGQVTGLEFRLRHINAIHNCSEIVAASLGLVASYHYSRGLAVPALVVCGMHVYLMRKSRRTLGMK